MLGRLTRNTAEISKLSRDVARPKHTDTYTHREQRHSPLERGAALALPVEGVQVLEGGHVPQQVVRALQREGAPLRPRQATAAAPSCSWQVRSAGVLCATQREALRLDVHVPEVCLRSVKRVHFLGAVAGGGGARVGLAQVLLRAVVQSRVALVHAAAQTPHCSQMSHASPYCHTKLKYRLKTWKRRRVG